MLLHEWFFKRQRWCPFSRPMKAGHCAPLHNVVQTSHTQSCDCESSYSPVGLPLPSNSSRTTLYPVELIRRERLRAAPTRVARTAARSRRRPQTGQCDRGRDTPLLRTGGRANDGCEHSPTARRPGSGRARTRRQGAGTAREDARAAGQGRTRTERVGGCSCCRSFSPVLRA